MATKIYVFSLKNHNLIIYYSDKLIVLKRSRVLFYYVYKLIRVTSVEFDNKVRDRDWGLMSNFETPAKRQDFQRKNHSVYPLGEKQLPLSLPPTKKMQF